MLVCCLCFDCLLALFSCVIGFYLVLGFGCGVFSLGIVVWGFPYLWFSVDFLVYCGWLGLLLVLVGLVTLLRFGLCSFVCCLVCWICFGFP